MKGTIQLGVVLAASALVAAPAVRAATYLPINHQRIVPLASREVWRRLHDFLQDQGFAVTSEAQAAGVIDASRSTPGRGGLTGFAQCDAHLFWRTVQARLALTIQLKPVDDGTRVTVNAGFLELAKPGKRGTASLPCTSNGVLESAVLNVASGQPMEAAVAPQ